MDYRLVPYIKKYLHEGHSLQQIRQSLLNQGVPDADIKQAALYAMDEGTKEIKKENSTMWIIPVLLILIIGGAGYYFQDPIKIFSVNTINRFSGQQSGIEQQIEQQTKQQTMQETQQNNKGNNKGLCDMNCLIASAENCNAASADFESRVDFFGMIIYSKNKYTITPGNKCTLNIKVLDADIEFSQEFKEQSLVNGITEEELTLQLEESRKSQKLTVGKEGVCVFDDTSKLKEFLEKTKEGTLSGSVTCQMREDCSIIINGNTTTYSEGCDDLNWECEYDGDWALGECTGSMFLG